MNADELLRLSAEGLLAAEEPELDRVQRAFDRFLRTGSRQAARAFVRGSVRWLRKQLATIFEGRVPKDAEILAYQATLRAPFSAWRRRAPGRSLLMTYVDSLRHIAAEYGDRTVPLRPPRAVPAATRRADAPATDVRLLRGIFDETMTLLASEDALDEIRTTFDLSEEEVGRLFGVTRQAVQQWRSRGLPPDRVADVDRVREVASILRRELVPERVPQIVRTRDDWLGGRSLLEVIAAEGVEPVYQYLERLFAYQPA